MKKIEKTDRCKNIPENSSTTIVREHIASGFSISTISSFKDIENNHNAYCGKDCMKKFCASLTEHAVKISNSKKKKNMKLLTKQQLEPYENAKICFIFKEKFEIIRKIKNIVKLEVIVIIQGKVELLPYVILKILYLKKFL